MEGKQNKLKGHKTIVSIFAVLTVMMLTLPAVGYALEQSAHTYNTGNSVETDCFTVGYYDDSGTEISPDQIFRHHLGYKLETVGDDKVCTFAGDGSDPNIPDDVSVVLDDLKLKVIDISGNNEDYTVSAKWTLVVNGAGSAIKSGTSPSMTVHIGDQSFTAGYDGSPSGQLDHMELESLTAVSFNINDVVTTGKIPTSLGISVALTVSSGNDGINSTRVVNLKAGSTVDAVFAYISDTLTIDGHKYSEMTNPTYHVNTFPEGDSPIGVVIQRDQSTITNTTDLAFNLPEDTEFMIEIYMPSELTQLTVKVFIDDMVNPVHTALAATPYEWDNEYGISIDYRHYIWNGCEMEKPVSTGVKTTGALYTPDSYQSVKNTYLNTDSAWFKGGDVKVTLDSNKYINKSTQFMIHLRDV